MRTSVALSVVFLAWLGLNAVGQPDQPGLDPLVEQLNSDDEAAQLDALWRLGRAGEAAAPAVPRLLELLSADSPVVAARAMRVLRMIGDPALPALRNMADQDWSEDDAEAWLVGFAMMAAPEANDPAAIAARALQAIAGEEVPGVWDAIGDLQRAVGAGCEPDSLVTPLVALLEDPSEWVRYEAVRALAALGPSAGNAVDPLVRLLDDLSPHVRAKAATALAVVSRPTEEARDALERVLEEERDPSVLVAAAEALCDLDQPAAATPALLQCLEMADQDRSSAIAACGRLVRLGPEERSAIVDAMSTGDASVLEAAVTALMQHDVPLDDMVPHLEALLGSASRTVQLDAIRVLGWAGEGGAQALLPYLDDGDDEIRQATALALKYTRHAFRAVPQYLAELNRNGNDGFHWAGQAISDAVGMHVWDTELVAAEDRDKLAEVTRLAVTEMTRWVADDDRDMRLMAMRVLTSLGPRAGDAVPALIAVLADNDIETVVAALTALSSIRTDDATVARRIASFLDHDDVDVREAAHHALAYLVGVTAEADSILTQRLRAGDSATRIATLDAIAWSMEADSGMAPVVATLIDDAEPEVRVAAARAAGGVEGDLAAQVVSALIMRLADPEHTVRVAAVAALGRLGSEAESAVPALAALLEDDASSRPSHPERGNDVTVLGAPPTIRTSIVDALGQIGSAAIPALAKALEMPGVEPLAAAELAVLGDPGERALVEALGARAAETRAVAGVGLQYAARLHAEAAHPDDWQAEALDAIHAATDREMKRLMSEHPSLEEALCLANMVEMLRGVDVMLDDWGGLLPDRLWTLDLAGEFEHLTLHVGRDTVTCPAAPEALPGFALNAAVAGLPPEVIASPETTPLFFEANLPFGSAVGGPEDAVARHRGKVVIGFVDRHVESLPLIEARRLLARDIE